jgi:pimeloyl-ACP methyl ester carboxylesterase
MSVDRWVETGYVAHFSRQFCVIAVDPLGHGSSDKPYDSPAYGLADCALDLITVLDAEGISEAHVWGYSRGAQIAGVMATLYPDRILSLVLGGVPPGPLHENVVAIYDQSTRDLIAKLASGDVDAALMGVNDEATRRMFRERNDFQAIAAAMTGSLGLEPRFDFTRLRRPPLAYAGEREMLIALFQRTATESGIALHVIPGADHARAFQDLDSVAPIVERHLSES